MAKDKTVGISQAAATALAADVIPYERSLLARAAGFITKGDFDIAVIVANTACEIAAEHALYGACSRNKFSDELAESVLSRFSTFNLENERLRHLYNALTVDLIEKQTFWPTFATSVGLLRHSSVHAGVMPTKEQAEAFHIAATQLVEYLFDSLNPDVKRPS